MPASSRSAPYDNARNKRDSMTSLRYPRRPLGGRLVQSVVVVALLAVAAWGVARAYGVASAATIAATECGSVPGGGTCCTPSASWHGGRRTLFRTVNGAGVSHTAILFDVRGTGTAQD